jgi:hypothetical protein
MTTGVYLTRGLHVARLASHHLASYILSQVGGAPSRPYKYPLWWKSEHTHHYMEIPLQSSHS